MVLLLVVSLSIFFALCFIYSVTKTRCAYTENEGCWLFCYLPVKISMPSCCSSCIETSQFCGSVFLSGIYGPLFNFCW